MNSQDRAWFEGKFSCMGKEVRSLHDDVLVIKTERATERKMMVLVSGAVAFGIATATKYFWR